MTEHDLELRIVLGGLRPGAAAQPLSPRLKEYLLHHWERIEAGCGQPFDRAALEAREETWMYDTELPAKAVVAMRRVRPRAELSFFVALQRAFYADGIDITDPAVYPALVAPFDVDPDEFETLLGDAHVGKGAWDDFAAARQLGATGFPTTLLNIDGRMRMLAAGYRPFAEVDEILHAALARFAPPEATVGAVCSIDGNC